MTKLIRFSCYILLPGIIILTTSTMLAQQSNKEPWYTKLVYGGNIGFQFGSQTRIDFSPEVGYRISDRLISGLGITYEYYRWKLFNYSTSLYGGKLFNRYYVYENLFALAEYEALNLDAFIFDVQGLFPDQERFWVHSVFLGGGYRQPIGKNSALLISVLWNINETPNSPYSNPIVRFGFAF